MNAVRKQLVAKGAVKPAPAVTVIEVLGGEFVKAAPAAIASRKAEVRKPIAVRGRNARG